MVNIRYVDFDNIKSVIFTKLESHTSQKGNISHKIDTGNNGNNIAFKAVRILLLTSTLAALCTTKNKSVILNPYNQSYIKQLGVCTVKLRHKDKDVKHRFFVVPGDGQAVLAKPDIKLLNILKIT